MTVEEAASSLPPARDCPVCAAPSSDARVFLRERLDARRLTGFSYASRKEPEFMNYRLVRCATCDLVYVDRPPSQGALSESYHVASYDSAVEAEAAARTYVGAIRSTLDAHRWTSALEIGTGTGAFLEQLHGAGFTTLVGIEPSAAAIAAAPASRRAWIRNSIFMPSDFAPASFDLACCFMTMEHVREPGELAAAVARLLRPGGALITVTHDYRSPVNRILGRRSPIIDIEHMQLFSRKSLGALFENADFQRVSMQSFVNYYPSAYWLRLLPLPRLAKRAFNACLVALRLDRVRLGFDVGNVVAVGFKGD